ncbi:GT2D2 protein, partial [Acromyrmex heyeri]
RMDKYMQLFDKVWEEMFFASINNKTICLLCGYQPSIVKKYILHRHYNIKHSKDYSKCELKLIYNINSSSRVDNATPSVKTLTASYAISNLITKNSKPFCEGEFVKECIIAAVESFGNSLTLEEAASIPLSDKTVKSRIDDIAYSLELKSLLASCSFFSLCLNESTDNRHMSQLSIFARIMQNDFSHVEELLDSVSLHDTTTGIDIFEAVNQTFQKFGYNMIKGGHKFLSHRKFQHFLETHNAFYTDIPLYCEVRWLSAGKDLEKFFAIRKEIFLFLQEYFPTKCDEFQFFFKNLD